MATSFVTGLSDDVKTFIEGTRRENRYAFVNSRNRNKKVIRSGASVTTQNLGIDAPTVAPTATAGTGGNLYYRYVYVSKTFKDPLALEDDNYIRSNASPVLTKASVSTPATNIMGTASTDTQVTHLWLYVSDSASGPFYRLPSSYEVTNTGTPTWATGVTSVPTTGYLLEIDNYPIETCRMAAECNSFYLFGGFVPMTNTGTVTIGASTVTMGSTIYDGVIALNLQFSTDSTGGPNNDGIHIAQYASANTVTLINPDGTARNYDGPSNKTNAALRMWRSGSLAQISKQGNPDFTPALIDPAYFIDGPGNITGIAKPCSGYAARIHYNDSGKKSVVIADFTQGVPPRMITAASPYSMSNPRACANSVNRIFYYDAAAGIIEDQGINHKNLTQLVIPNLMRSLNATSSDTSEMEYDEYRNLLFLTCAPAGYTKNYYFIIYNLTTNTFNLWFMVPDVLSMRKIYDSNEIPYIYCGSSNGSITIWPSSNFNEAVGTSTNGIVSALDDSTHLTVAGTPFPTTGDKLKDRWVMTWNDNDDIPTYQFARVSDNTDGRLTLDTFIGPNSTSGFSPIPAIGDAYWMGPIQSIIGPNWDFNAIPDEDGQVLDVSMTLSGLEDAQVQKLSLYRNLETDPSVGATLVHNLYAGGTVDPNHISFKSGANRSIEATGITGWQITDNNEAGISIKSLVKRIRHLSPHIRGKISRES